MSIRFLMNWAQSVGGAWCFSAIFHVCGTDVVGKIINCIKGGRGLKCARTPASLRHTHTHFITVTDLRRKTTIQVHFRFRRMLISIYNTNNPSAGITEFVSPSMQKQNPHITGETSPRFVLLEQQLLEPINLLFFFRSYSQSAQKAGYLPEATSSLPELWWEHLCSTWRTLPKTTTGSITRLQSPIVSGALITHNCTLYISNPSKI